MVTSNGIVVCLPTYCVATHGSPHKMHDNRYRTWDSIFTTNGAEGGSISIRVFQGFQYRYWTYQSERSGILRGVDVGILVPTSDAFVLLCSRWWKRAGEGEVRVGVSLRVEVRIR